MEAFLDTSLAVSLIGTSCRTTRKGRGSIHRKSYIVHLIGKSLEHTTSVAQTSSEVY